MSRLAPELTARRRSVVTADDGSRAEVDFDLAESPLAWLASRRDKDGSPLISPAEFQAGERFRRDFTLAGLMTRTTMNWEVFGGRTERRSGRGSSGLIADAAIDARQRVERALTALGPELAGVAIDVCCHLKGLVDVERRHGWPQRSGKVVLRLALSSLARHYGLDDVGTGRGSSPTRHWGTDDFRPTSSPPELSS